MNLNILYEDNHLIVIDKEAGILSQRDSSGIPSILEYTKNYIKTKYHKSGNVYLGLVHRLDKPVSGVQVLARTSKAAQRLHQEFAGRRTIKMYVALVESDKAFEHGKWIDREDTLIRKRGFSELSEHNVRNGKSARIRIMILTSNEAYSLVLVRIATGRKHQIRAQLSAMAMPILGDTKYGSGHAMADGSICLHAIYIQFMHPTKKTPIEIFSKIPERISERIAISEVLVQKLKDAIASQTGNKTDLTK